MPDMFHDVRLPDDIEQGAKGGPEFATSVVETAAGTEYRNRLWSLPRQSWEVGYGMMDRDRYTVVRAFFYARNGRAYGFRFKDWTDFEATDVLIGVGDGAATNFQLVVYYEDDENTFTRIITRPVESTVVVRVNGVTKTLTSDYTIEDFGGIKFVSAPPNGHDVTATFEFDVPVRFDVDKLDQDVTLFSAVSVPSITLRELREGPSTFGA